MNTRTPLLSLAIASAALLATGMQDPRPQEPLTAEDKNIHLQELDRNGDNFLTPEELEADHRLAIDFAMYDTDADGRISEAEFFAYIDATTEE